jgi:hypothetical protein
MDRNQSLCTVLDPRGQPSGIFGQSLTPESRPGDIQDPFAQPIGEVRPVRMAPRSGSLDGKTLYLVETGFAGSYDFIQEVQDWFSRNMPSVKTVLRRKQGTMFTNDPTLWEEIRAKGDGAILGVGG